MEQMIQTELSRYEQVLRNRVGELERAIRHRDGIAIERSADQLDETQRAAERTLAVTNLDRESRNLRHARAALDRIQDGSYGTCLDCEDDIHPKRLAAVPWAPYCIRCQESRDHQETQSSYDEFLPNAA